MEFDLLKQHVLDNKTFVITTHVNPDADAIGSQMGLYHILKKLNKSIRCINYSVTPNNLDFLDPDSLIETYDPQKHDDVIKSADVLFLLDLNQKTRVVKMQYPIMEFKGPKICIDHHQEPDDLANLFFTEEYSAATCEILYHFLQATNIVEIDKNIATCLYSGIMTDTGSFRYERTTPDTHLIAADLLKHGVIPNKISEAVFDRGRLRRLKLLGRALTSLKREHDGKVCYMTVYQTDLDETGADESDVEGFVNFSLTVDGVRIGLLFFELKDGLKISFRSRDDIAINRLAGEYNGGGHVNAAGTRLYNANIDDYIKKVVARAKDYLD